jgi:hypothetical protein
MAGVNPVIRVIGRTVLALFAMVAVTATGMAAVDAIVRFVDTRAYERDVPGGFRGPEPVGTLNGPQGRLRQDVDRRTVTAVSHRRPKSSPSPTQVYSG